jgi:signal transduction histidine kinase
MINTSALEMTTRQHEHVRTTFSGTPPTLVSPAEMDCAWKVTVDVLPQLICLLDQEGRIIQANQTLERWQLGAVAAAQGCQVHYILHPGCPNPRCYLTTYLEQMWREVSAGRPVECEAKDELLMRHLFFQLRPAPGPSFNQAATPDNLAVLIIEDISEQKQAEAALRQYARDLALRNQELDAFAHTVAHNLKDQLTPIIGYAETLQAIYQHINPDQIRKDLEVISRNGHKMSRIIDELLLLAKVRKAEITLKPLDMAAILHEVQQRMAYVLHQFEVELILPERWPVVLGYAPWVEEIWTNYLSNAIKYGGHPPRIELGATVLDGTPEMVRFWVQDNGLGLKPAELAKLFAPFTQLKLGRGKGHGLGLSIVQQIAEKLGGQVAVESEGIPGHGCMFSFTLPATAGPD